MRIALLSALCVLPLGAACFAQPAPPAAGAQGSVVSVVSDPPAPDLPPNSRPSAYLRAAQGALATGDLGETEQALEMAQTRILDRSVPLFQTNTPSDNPATAAITQARQALAAHDRAACMQSIQTALAAATAQGL